MNFDINDTINEPTVAGTLGGLVGLKFIPGTSWGEKLFNLVSSALLAAFCTPALVQYWNLTSSSMTGFLGFAIGLFGMSLAAAVMQAIRNLDLVEFIKSWLPRKGS